MQHIPLTRPDAGEAELAEVAAVLETGHLTQGPKVAEFEGTVAGLVSARNAIATTSATTALHLTLAAMGIGPGDEVLVADFTFPATANVVVQQGATPVLVDVDMATFAMDPAHLEQRISTRSRLVMPVHPFGAPADIGSIVEVANRHGLSVVEDAACALGASFEGRKVGAIGAAGCFSFHPRKSITTGEGGMVVTDDDGLADRLRLLRSHGGRRAHGRFTFDAAGYNYRLSDILAAVGVAQLRKLDALLSRRRDLAGRYNELLAHRQDLRCPTDPPWGRHVYQSYVVVLAEGIDRDRVIASLARNGIETTIGTYALHREPFFAREFRYGEDDLPNAARLFHRTLSLPLFPSMQATEQDYVVERLGAALDRA